MEAPGTLDRHRNLITTSSDVDPSDGHDLHRDLLTDRTTGGDPPHDRGALDRGITIVHLAEASSDGVEDSWKNTTIAVRSNRDRAAIVDLSSWNRFHYLQKVFNGGSRSRSAHDRGPIVVRSWLLLRLI